jgi:phospholipid/cholesterol/gamma-HCH transport system substrate-binding protein
MNKLKLTWQRMQNVPGLRRDIALLTAVVLLGLSTGGYLLSRYDWDRPGADHFVFSAEFDQAPAVQLASRQEVRIAGVTVGKIIDAEPTERGTARVTVQIDPGHEVYQNARLMIRSKTPLNVMYVTLDPGGPPAKPLSENGVIPQSQTKRALQPYELLDELDGRTRAALTQLIAQADVAFAHGARDLPQGLDALGAAAKSFEPVVQELSDRRENIRRIVTAVSRISQAAGEDDKQLARLVASLEEALVVVSHRDKDLAATLRQLPGVTRVLRGAMSSAGDLTKQLNPTLVSLHRASGELPGALHSLGATVDEARALVGKAGPVVARARGVVRDLRPLVSDVDSALGDLAPVTSTLPGATARLVPWLDDLGAFIYNTSSSFSLADVNGGFGRASVVLKVTEPTGGPFL